MFRISPSRVRDLCLPGAPLVALAMTTLVACGGEVNNPLAPSRTSIPGGEGILPSSGLMLHADAPGTTRIAPTNGSPGGNFTIVDAPHGRLTDGAVARFEGSSGSTLFASLRTHRPYMSAQGTLPSQLVAGIDYFVTVVADGHSFAVGWFQASRVTLEQAVISPSQGIVGTTITIDDPLKRMQSDDDAVFYLPGDNPLTGTPAVQKTISTDGVVLTARVPEIAAGLQYYVAVVSLSTGEIRFQGLGFFLGA